MDLCNRQLWCWTGGAGAGNASVVACKLLGQSRLHAARSVSHAHLMAGRVVARCVARVESRQGRGSLSGGGLLIRQVRGTPAGEGVCGTGTSRHQMQRELVGPWSSFSLLQPRVLLPFCLNGVNGHDPRPRGTSARRRIWGVAYAGKWRAALHRGRCCTTAYLAIPGRAAAPTRGLQAPCRQHRGAGLSRVAVCIWHHACMSFVIHGHSGGPTSYRQPV